jgi:hypothetical protein
MPWWPGARDSDVHTWTVSSVPSPPSFSIIRCAESPLELGPGWPGPTAGQAGLGYSRALLPLDAAVAGDLGRGPLTLQSTPGSATGEWRGTLTTPQAAPPVPPRPPPPFPRPPARAPGSNFQEGLLARDLPKAAAVTAVPVPQ